MITPKFLIFLTIGTLAMLVPLLVYGKWHRVKVYKSVLSALLLTATGTTGTYLLGMLENQFRFGSRSFYGAVFLIPVAFLLVAKLIRIPYGQLMDMSAPSVCIMLVLMKVLCFLEGCCGGRELFKLNEGRIISFPSQGTELLAAVFLAVLLLSMARQKKYQGQIYLWYLVLYGVLRFILNFFRANTTPFLWILPAGHFWSLIAVAVGGNGLVVCRKRNGKAVFKDEIY